MAGPRTWRRRPGRRAAASCCSAAASAGSSAGTCCCRPTRSRRSSAGCRPRRIGWPRTLGGAGAVAGRRAGGDGPPRQPRHAVARHRATAAADPAGRGAAARPARRSPRARRLPLGAARQVRLLLGALPARPAWLRLRLQGIDPDRPRRRCSSTACGSTHQLRPEGRPGCWKPRCGCGPTWRRWSASRCRRPRRPARCCTRLEVGAMSGALHRAPRLLVVSPAPRIRRTRAIRPASRRSARR